MIHSKLLDNNKENNSIIAITLSFIINVYFYF